jgi:carbon monoxide dehydrogenase subunit G
MNFNIDARLPASPERLWTLFFDVQRVAALIPGCENVQEQTPLVSYSAVMKQKIGPFKLEVPAAITVEEHLAPQRVQLRAHGKDKFTGTTLDVLLKVNLTPQAEGDTHLLIDADMQVQGRLASLGFGVVKKKSEELFAEFEKRLRAELETV